MIKIWDLWIRLFHWSLVIAVGFSLLSGETGVGFFDWHRLAGEIVLALIVFRIAWGFLGSSNARLLGLMVNPVHSLNHLRELAKGSVPRVRGHNAAGGWAVLLMLLLISIQAITGLFIADEEDWVSGALHGRVSTETSDLLYNIHHTNAGLLQAIVIVHIVMIAIYYIVARHNLVKPMITGNIDWPSDQPAPKVRFGNFVLGLVFTALAFLAVALLVGWF